MKKNKKIIIILAIITLIILIICVALLLYRKNTNNLPFIESTTQQTTTSSNNTDNASTKNNTVKRVTNIKKVYNIGKCIDDMIKDFYEKGLYKYKDSLLLSHYLTEKLSLETGKKSFYINSAYEASLDKSIIIYLAKGYIVNESEDPINKEEISLMVINDTEYNTARIELYGTGYSNTFLYDEDIANTEIVNNNKLKIEKTDSDNKQLGEVLMEDEFFQNRYITEDVSEKDLVYWFFKDYKINQANSNKEKLQEDISFSYAGNYENGYTVIEKETKYQIKPGSNPMEYEISIINN
ncbi:MAG: hypothetical protein IKF97_01395 [Clostridia bacterium]|nr:hypothetical protein [Clostridia bacterium]